MKLSKLSKVLCLVLVSVLVISNTVMAANIADFVDFPNDWSTPAMEYAVENGLIKGYEDNTIRAERIITRAEMGAIVNRAFGSFVEATKFPYLDVEDTDWFCKDMKKAVNMGTMQGSDNLLRPDDAITREEAFIVLARAYSQKNEDFSVLEQYGDYENISEWAKDYLSFLTGNDYVNGFDDGKLYPKSNLTRAELSQVLYNMLNVYVSSQSELDQKAEYNGNVVINGKIAEINGKTFDGDLVIGDGVGIEKIVIKDTKISGCLIIRGTTQIKIVNSTVGNRIIVNNPNNNVHFDNYKTEKVFKNVEVLTSATWKTPSSGGRNHGDGVTTTYTVSYYLNYDKNDMSILETQNIEAGKKATKPTDPTRAGYDFGGWYTTRECDTAFDFDSAILSKTDLYAKWTAKTPVATTYKLTFDVNGGNDLVLTDELKALGYDMIDGKLTVKVTNGGNYPQLPVATYPSEEKSFGGWELDGKIILSGDKVEITEDTVLKAVWLGKHMVVFHNYYNNKDQLKVYVEDGKAIEKPQDPTFGELEFAGWYTDEDCTDGNEFDFTTVLNKVEGKYQTIHLYPKWLVTVTFYYGPEAKDSEKVAEVEVIYNTAIPETKIPASRKEKGYWKDGNVSDAYLGEEYSHEIEFLWYEENGKEFKLFDKEQLIKKNKNVFNLSKYVSIYVDAIAKEPISAYYTEEEAIYETILDVIFLHKNVARTAYENLEQKDKVFDKLISLGIIDKDMNILNQAAFLKFSLMGEERLEKFVYENVENELTVDAEESITSYLNHLIEKNDGSAEKFLKELIDSLLAGEGKEEMKGVLADMLTEMVDIERDEFIKYVNKYIDDSIAAGNKHKVEDLIHPQIEKLLTETIAKDFARKMSKEQLTEFINIYVGTLTETELKAEVKEYINGLGETEIEAEVLEYVNSNTDIKTEITTYINSLTPEQLNSEITIYVNEMDPDELSDAIVEYIKMLSPDARKAEINTYISNLAPDAKKKEIEKYIDGLSDTERAEEITSYVDDMSDAQFKAEIKDYIGGLGDSQFEEELKKYLEENDDEYEKLIREYLDIDENIDITVQDKIDHLEDVINYVMTEPGKRDEVTGKAAEYITTSKRSDYEDEIISKVTSKFDSYKDSIVDKAVTSNLSTYIAKAVDKIVVGTNLDGYISDTAYSLATGENKTAYTQKAINTIISDEDLKAKYTSKTIDDIVSGSKKAEYVTKAVKKILAGADRDKYIDNTINKIFADDEEQTYIDKAVAKIVGDVPADYSQIDEYINTMFSTGDKKAKVVSYINDQFIESKDFRKAILPDAVDMIFADSDSKAEVVETIVDFVINDEDALAEVIDIAIKDLINKEDFRENTIYKIADYLEHHPEIMDEVVEYAKESELGVFVEKFIDELMTKDKFEVSKDNLFVAEAIERALGHYDYDSFMNEFVPERFAGLIPDEVLEPIYNNTLNGFKEQLHDAIGKANNGEVAYVDSGVTVKINPIADIIVPVFDKYLELKEKGEDKLDSNNGTVGNIYDKAYGENKYVKALVDLLSIKNFLNGDKSQATEILSGYSLKEFGDYYTIFRNASALLSDAGKWYIDNLPKDKAEEAQEKLARKITEYFNSILALVNTYAETEELPSYKDVLDIFEGDIPDRFFDKYESALSKVESKVDIDDKLETAYDKLAEKGIVSKFNTVLDKFVASKFNREIREEQIPMIYTIVRKILGYDDFYTVDTVFNVMNEKLTRFKVDEDTFVIGNEKLKITIEREYR